MNEKSERCEYTHKTEFCDQRITEKETGKRGAALGGKITEFYDRRMKTIKRQGKGPLPGKITRSLEGR